MYYSAILMKTLNNILLLVNEIYKNLDFLEESLSQVVYDLINCFYEKFNEY